MWLQNLMILMILIGSSTAPSSRAKEQDGQFPALRQSSDSGVLLEKNMNSFRACRNSRELIRLFQSVYYAIPSYRAYASNMVENEYTNLKLSLHDGFKIVDEILFKNLGGIVKITMNVHFPCILLSGTVQSFKRRSLLTTPVDFVINYGPMTMQVFAKGMKRRSDIPNEIIFDDCSIKLMTRLTAKVELEYKNSKNKIERKRANEMWIPGAINHKLMVTLGSLCRSLMMYDVFGGTQEQQLEKVKNFLKNTNNIVLM